MSPRLEKHEDAVRLAVTIAQPLSPSGLFCCLPREQEDRDPELGP